MFVVLIFSTNISSPGANGKDPPLSKNPLSLLPSLWVIGAFISNVTIWLLSVVALVTRTPFEFIVGIILRSSDKPVSLVNISTLLTEVPFKLTLVTILSLPIAITDGGDV